MSRASRICTSWAAVCSKVRNCAIPSFLMIAWAVGVLLHWALIVGRCGWTGDGCSNVFSVGNSTSDIYISIVQNGPMVASVVGLLFLWKLHRKGENWRMRFAIAVVAQIVVAAGYITAHNWIGLNGSAAPTETIRNVGLAIAAVLTLFFVVWRERIASNQMEVNLSSSLAERFQHGARLLTSGNEIERIAGIHAIRELAIDSMSARTDNCRYYQMCFDLLKQTCIYRQRNRSSHEELSEIKRAFADL